MADLLAAGKSVLDQMFGKLPEADRAALAPVFQKPEAQEALKTLGESALMRSDYSRHMDAVAQDHAKLTKWYEEQKANLELGVKAREKGWNPDAPATDPLAPAIPADVMRRADVDKLITARETEALAFIGHSNRLAFDHFQKFGEPLDIPALAADPRANEIGLMGVYQARFGDRLAAKAKEAEDARIGKLVEERMVEERRKLVNRPPDSMGSPSLGSPLDALEATAAGKPGLVSEATDMYQTLVAGTR